MGYPTASNEELAIDSKHYADNELSADERQALFQMAMQTAEGIFNAGWTEYGYWYTTPEGWEVDGSYRSKGYMRPLSVWAIQSALDKSSRELNLKPSSL